MMIQPHLSDQMLIADINAARPASGQASIWWLGQSGYAIKTASTLLYIDLYLSDYLTNKYANSAKPHIRMSAPPLNGTAINNADWVFVSHQHGDHLDPLTLPQVMRASPQARLVLPNAIGEAALNLGIAAERLLTMQGDDQQAAGSLTIHAIPAAHPTLAYQAGAGYPCLGYMIVVDGVRLYHSGDTLVYDGLAERLRALAPDVLFLPINGTSDHLRALNVPPNMNAGEALALAGAVGRGLVIPHHYDMFTFNTADVGHFAALARQAKQAHQLLRLAEGWTFSLAANSV